MPCSVHPGGTCCSWAVGERVGPTHGGGWGVRAQTGTVPTSLTWVAYFAEELIFKCKYLDVLIIYLILKIILKERQERKQQRLQENAVSPAFASDDVQDGESGGDDQALGQPDPSGTEFCWFAS